MQLLDSEHQAIARLYAPIVFLHEEEEYWPDSPDNFLQRCHLYRVDPKSLRVNGLFDFAAGNFLSATPDAHVPLGVPSAQLHLWSGSGVRTRRPHTDFGDVSFDLVGVKHTDRRPSGVKDPRERVPVFYRFTRMPDDEVALSYWIFYGYSLFEQIGPAEFAHQGDWEHITLRLARNSVVGAWFWAHGEMHYKDREEMTFRNRRPAVYVAKGRHGCYWKPGRHRSLSTLSSSSNASSLDLEAMIFWDVASDDGYVWDVCGSVVALEACRWHPFAGAWGEVGKTGNGTGPLGPWYQGP